MSSAILATTAILCIIINQSQSAVCTDYQQCIGQSPINSFTVECSGAESCRNVTNATSEIQSTTALTCSGAYSCDYSNLYGRLYLNCNGGESCRFGDLRGKYIKCAGSESCVSNPSFSVGNILSCNGYKSCSRTGSTLFSINWGSHCQGSQSCQGNNNQLLGSGAWCGGYQSCESTTLRPKGTRINDEIECLGYQSCANADIASVDELQLHGAQSGLNAAINDATLIEAYGRRSLQGANVDSGPLSRMEVKLLGYEAGYNTDIICRSGAICDITCKNIACQSTSLRCLPGSTCNISPSNCELDNSVLDVNGIYCPIVYDTISSSGTETHEHQHDFDFEQMSNIKLSAYTTRDCFTENECVGDRFRNNREEALCYGKGSCQDIISAVTEYNGCLGQDSCISANVAGPVGTRPYQDCLGENSCQDLRYDSSIPIINGETPKLNCDGKLSCKNARELTFIAQSVHNRFIDCTGDAACTRIKYESDVQLEGIGYLNCFGHRSCRLAKLTVGTELYCHGTSSCKLADIISRGDKEIQCYGWNSCRKSNIESDGTIVFDGKNAGTEATISAVTVIVNGYYGIAYATIDSQDKDTELSVYGHSAGNGATFICRDGSNCKLNCVGTSCRDMNYICLTGATCNIIPSECSFRDVIEGTVCPNMLTSIPLEKDYENDEIYQSLELEMKQHDMLDELLDANADGDIIDEYLKSNWNYLENEHEEMELFGNIEVMMQKHLEFDMTMIIGVCGILFIITSLIYYGYRTKMTGKDEYESLV